MAKKKKGRKQAKLIFNPGSGGHRDATARLERIVRCLDEHGIDVDVALARPSEAAEPIAKQAVREGFKLVIVAGGDGTIEGAARGVIGSKTWLGIIPSGTSNNNAKSLGLPEEIEAACALIAEGPKRKIDVGQLKRKGKKRKYYFLEASWLGLTAVLYPKAKRMHKGDLRHLGDAISRLLTYHPHRVFMTLDDDSRLRVDTLLVTVANEPLFGASFLVAPNASLEDGLLDIAVYPGFSKAQILAHLAHIQNAGVSYNLEVQRYRARKVRIVSKNGVRAIADSQEAGMGDFVIRVVPGALRVIAPPAAGLAQEPPPAEEQLPAPAAPAMPPSDEAEKAAEATGKAPAAVEAPVQDRDGRGRSRAALLALPLAAGIVAGVMALLRAWA